MTTPTTAAAALTNPTKDLLPPDVAIVLVNWHGSDDTIACLESLERLDTSQARTWVVVVDNASTDRSPERITDALSGRGYRRAEVQPPAPEERRLASVDWYSREGSAITMVGVVCNRENYGFAAGNNIGIAVANTVGIIDYFWVLNNDTEVNPDALRLLVARMQRDASLGMCGCTLVFHDDPQCIQCCGGVRYSAVTGRGWPIGAGLPLSLTPAAEEVQAELSYISGASMFVRGTLINQIGLMSEDYFLYNEEIDWAWRSRHIARLGVEPRAIVVHKEGKTIGTETTRQQPSALANFYQTRSKLLFARKFTPWFLPTVWLTLFARFFKFYVHGGSTASFVILQVLFGRKSPDPAWFRRRTKETTNPEA